MLNIDLGGAKRKNTPNDSWKIMDISPISDYFYDITSGKKINIDDNTIDNYYTSYTIFFTKQNMIIFLFSELYRTLKPGGLIRIVIPDIEKSIKWYIENPENFKFKYAKPINYPETKLGYLMALFHTEDTYIDNKLKTVGIQQAFDFETLTYYLKRVKFKDIKKLDYNICSDVFIGKDYKRYDGRGLFVEARK